MDKYIGDMCLGMVIVVMCIGIAVTIVGGLIRDRNKENNSE